MGCLTRRALALVLLASAALSPAHAAGVLRRPRGVYAKVDVSDYIQSRKLNPTGSDDAFIRLYRSMLSNPAISGLTLQLHWSFVNPFPPTDFATNPYRWDYVDDAFAEALAWNNLHPKEIPKTIQLIVTAGFNSPAWLVDPATGLIPSCDRLFEGVPDAPGCGTVTFIGYFERIDGTALPLPWNTVYQDAWKTFLSALNDKYGANDLFVSISIAGPTAASAEMILPSDANVDPVEQHFGTTVTTPNAMWTALLKRQYPNQPGHWTSDQAFIEEWKNAIRRYAEIFRASGVTLVATPGAGTGLPDFAGVTVKQHKQNVLYKQDCNASLTGVKDLAAEAMSCEAVTTIVSHFIETKVARGNAKATQTSGMAAWSPDTLDGPDAGDVGIAGVKLLTAPKGVPSAEILGGAQFDHPISDNDTIKEGCPDEKGTGCDTLTPEAAEFNVLKVFFNQTRAAAFFDGTKGVAPLNYLQVFYQDVEYAQRHPKPQPVKVDKNGNPISLTVQELLELASQDLAEIGQPVPLPVPSCVPSCGGDSLCIGGRCITICKGSACE
jgi:hypothetical protein